MASHSKRELRTTIVPYDVERSLQDLGLEVERSDEDEIYASCPGHPRLLGKLDAHTSWSVNRRSGKHHCFSCSFGGGFTVIVQEVLGCSWQEARAWTESRAGGIEAARQMLERVEQPPRKVVDTSEQVNEASLALFTDPPAEALSGRSLSLASSRLFGVRWDPTREMWILPVRDPVTSKLWGWQEKNARYFNNYPKHVQCSKTLFGIQNVVGNRPVILVESPLDAVRLGDWPTYCAVASFGSNVSDDQLTAILNVTDALIVAMDNYYIDPAGCLAMQNICRRVAGRMRVRIFDYENIDVKDIGDMTDEQIKQGLANAYSSVLAKF